MNWIFPIAGFGTRTSSLGKYKPFVEPIDGYSILNICLLGLKSLINKDDSLIFITTKPHDEECSVEFNIQKLIKRIGLNNMVDVVILPHTPKGQALTLKEGIENLERDIAKERVIVINSDQLVFFDLKKIDMANCAVGLYFNDGNSSCFYELNLKSNLVMGIKEKEKISNYASAGVFYFTSVQRLLECINWGIKNNKIHNGELYLGPCMEYLDRLSFFKTLIKFDLGNTDNINLFKRFGNGFLPTGDNI